MKTLKTLTGLVITILLAACSSSASIRSDHDVTVDFNTYKTYSYLPWSVENSEYVTAAAKERLYGLLDAEMTSLGYTKVSGNSDLAINLLVLLDERREATAYTRYYTTGGYGYYFPFGYGIQSTTFYRKEDVLEGTLIVDMFDQKERKLIWQGVTIMEVVEQDGKRQRQVNSAVKKMFQSFPGE